MTIDPISQRFQAANAALKELIEWIEKPYLTQAPICVVERCKVLHISVPSYFRLWKTRLFPSPWRDTESNALEDWAIQQVQPGWKRKP